MISTLLIDERAAPGEVHFSLFNFHDPDPRNSRGSGSSIGRLIVPPLRLQPTYGYSSHEFTLFFNFYVHCKVSYANENRWETLPPLSTDFSPSRPALKLLGYAGQIPCTPSFRGSLPRGPPSPCTRQAPPNIFRSARIV